MYAFKVVVTTFLAVLIVFSGIAERITREIYEQNSKHIGS